MAFEKYFEEAKNAGIKEYELYDFQDFLNDVKGNNMKYNLAFEF